MTTAIAAKATPSAAAEGSPASPAAAVRTVHERKLAVMGRCAEIRRDASYVVQGKKVEYVSITHLCDSLRRYCVAEGLDLNPSIADGVVTIELVNAAVPSERIVSTWPVVPNDKGWSYSIKYALIRLFLIGDGEENEQSGADNSATAANAPTPAPRQPAPQATAAPIAGERALLSAALMAMPGEPRMTVLRSFGYRGSPLSQWLAKLDEDVVDKLTHAINGKTSGNVDPDDIPF